MRLTLRAACLALGLLPLWGGSAWASPCEAPAELLDSGMSLPATERAIAQGALRILVVGSASVMGPGTSSPAYAWPAQLAAGLRDSRPGLAVELVVRGGRGMTVGEMLPVLQGASPPPQLVIWQVGTVETARGLEPDWLADRLAEGLDGLRERGIDAVLVDQQFSRFMRANADIAPYQDAIRIAAAAGGVPLFPRYELMRHWADAERIDVERAPRAGRTAMVDQLGECLGRALSVLVLRGVAAVQRN